MAPRVAPGAGPPDGALASRGPEQEHALAHTPTDELLALPFLDAESMGQAAYGYAKRGNHLRVQAESLAWGRRGARVNAISPGIINTRWPATRCPAQAARRTRR